jgi:hypothetical protein
LPTLAAAVLVFAGAVSSATAAQMNEVRYLSRESAHAYSVPQAQPSGSVRDSLGGGHQIYTNPDRDYFSGSSSRADF